MANKAGKLAKRYAKAFLRSIEEEQGKVSIPTPAQQAASALQDFAALWQHTHNFSQSILSPMFDRDERRKAFLQVAKESGLNDLLLRFLGVIFERDRLVALPEIAEHLYELADQAAGIVRVEVATAHQLNEEEARGIEVKLQAKIEGQAMFSWRVDPTILGGMFVRFSGKVIDASLRGKLERLEQSLGG